MVKCGLVGCEEKAVGGFQEILRTHQSAYAIIDGLNSAWCARHEESLRRHVLGKRGTWLTAKDLKD